MKVKTPNGVDNVTITSNDIEKSELHGKNIESQKLFREISSPLNDGEGLMKRIDFGHISSVQGTPAKTLQVLEYEASPVLSRSSKN